MRLASLALPALVLAGCGGGAGAPDAGGPDARPPFPDLSGVEPVFAPTTATIAEIVGLAVSAPTAEDLATLGAAGLRAVRRDLLWHVVEPTRGARDFAAYDGAIDDALAAGVETVPILAYGNPWATAGAEPDEIHRPPDDPADFAAFAGAAAARYRGRVRAYEIWNEPDLGFRFWQPREDPAAYGDLLAAAAASVRAADPDARVVLGGLIYHPYLSSGAEVFLEDLYLTRPAVAASFDVLAFHPYPVYPPHVAPEVDDPVTGDLSAPRMVARLRAILAWYGDADKPLWATEVGWPTFDNGTFRVDEERQARWAVRVVLLLAGAGVERVFWFTLRDGPLTGSFPPEDDFGLWRWGDPPAPKPSWQALATLVALTGELAVADAVPLLGAPEDAHAYRLQGAARRVTVVWRADDVAAPQAVAVPVDPARTVSLRDLYGAPLAVGPDAVPLSGAPVYVIEE